MPGRQARRGLRLVREVRAAARAQLTRLPGQVDAQHVRVLLMPVQAALRAEDAQAQVVLVPDLNLRAPQHAPRAADEAQQQVRVVVETAARHEGREVRADRLDLQTRDGRDEVLRVRADVPHGARDAGPLRVGAPVGLLVVRLLELRGEPALVVLHDDLADLAEGAAPHERARLSDHGVARVVVRHGEHHARALGDLHEVAGLLGRVHERLVAHDVHARRREGARHLVVHVVGRDDAHHLDPLALRQGELRAEHLPPRGVGPRGVQAQRGAGPARPLWIAGERARDELVLPVERGGHAVHRADEGALAAADHAEPHAYARPGLLLLAREGRVERAARRREVQAAREGRALRRAEHAVHAGVLPLDAEGPGVPDVVEGHHDRLEVDVAAPDGAEVPVARGVPEGSVPAEHADLAVAAAPPDVLHVHVEDPLREDAQELHVVHALVAEVAGVVVEAEARVVPDGVERLTCRGDVEGDLGGVHLQPEVHVHRVEGLQDGRPAAREVLEAALPVRRGRRREGVQAVPDGRAREAVDDLHAEPRRGAAREDHLLGGATAHTLGVTVAPDVLGHDVAVPLVDQVAHGLPDEVIGDREERQAVVREEFTALADVRVVLGGAADVHVIAPAGEFEAVVAHAARERREFGEGQVGPLAGEQGDRAGQGGTSLEVVSLQRSAFGEGLQSSVA